MPVGSSRHSCGSPDQNLEPVDCSASGDFNSMCVFSNHCLCSEGYICDGATQSANASECDPGSICIPNPMSLIGTTAQECGAPDQGLDPVDCTAAGDLNSVCVYSNHCMCSEGYICQSDSQWPNTSECDPGSICVPLGVSPQSCGLLGQEHIPVDCTSGGDQNANCVYGHHCMCSEGYSCETELMSNGSECEPGVRCVISE